MNVAAGGQTYDFTVPANGSFPLAAVGSYFRFVTSTGSLTVRMNGTSSLLKGMIAGQGVQGQDFLSLELFNTTAAAISGTIFVGQGGFFDLNLNLSGGIAVRPEPSSGDWSSVAVTVANTAVQIVAPASNTAGMILLSAHATYFDNGGAIHRQVLIAKSSPPTSVNDGEIIAANWETTFFTTGYTGLLTARDVNIGAGKGLYFIENVASGIANANMRSARYKLL